MMNLSIDMGALNRLISAIGGSFEDFAELREDYVKTAPGLIDDMLAACAALDFEAMRIAAHSLKSNARDFGAIQLSERCELLEIQCRNGKAQDAEQLIEEIRELESLGRTALLRLGAGDVSGD